MNRLSTRSAGAAMLALFAVGVVLIACADSDEANPLGDPNETDSGGVTTFPEASAPADAGVEDANADADAPKDAETDAAARICSDDNFCHSVLPGNHALRGVWGDGQGIVWAVSSGGSVLRWDGSVWTEHSKDLGGLSTIWGSGPTDLWLVASNGTVYHGTGASSAEVAFAPVALPGDARIPIKSIGGTGPNDVWAVGGLKDDSDWPWQWKGRVLHYDGDAVSGGSGWTVDDELSSRSIACVSVAASASSGIWIIGQEFRQDSNELLHGVLLRRAPGAAEWTNVELPMNLANSWRSSPVELDVVATTGTGVWVKGIIETNDSQQQSPLWRGTSTNGGMTLSWSFVPQQAWAPEVNAVWGTVTNEVWAVGRPGRVTRWTGTKWQQAAIRVTNTPVVTPFHGIWGTSDTDFWVVGDNAALHKTTGTKP